jgi:hypothetical protein
MTGYHYLALSALLLCLITLTYHVVRLMRLGPPRDFARSKASPRPAIAYSFLGAMSPVKKESAYLHLPTYTAGLLYHAGTFTAIVLFFPLLLDTRPKGWLLWGTAGLLILSGLSGVGILLKRLVVKKLRTLSNPDDYLSNALVTLLQFLTLAALVGETAGPLYFLCVSVLLLYIPLGKLKHALYFFAARYQLGLFYGRRGVWPPKKGEPAA